jgi:MoaA/NifB/PqqE/SkfB family radical SAM enzyme
MIELDTVCVELTLRCPLRCVHCSANAAPERREMLDADLLVRRLREVRRLKALYLSGGEPFEHRALGEIARAAQGLAHEVAIYSSGVCIGKRAVEPLSERAIHGVANTVDRVDVSLYSLSPAEHDSVTGVGGSLHASLESIRRLRLLGVPFGIHFVPLCGETALMQVAQYAREVGAQRIHVLAIARQGRATNLKQAYSASLLSSLRFLVESDLGMEVLVSSHLRRLLGVSGTERDHLRTAFIDVRGHMYSSEGARTPDKRSLRTLKDSRIEDLVADMA